MNKVVASYQTGRREEAPQTLPAALAEAADGAQYIQYFLGLALGAG
jgi:hypothetical protein